jgi:uncharacterized DUF497 family protein
MKLDFHSPMHIHGIVLNHARDVFVTWYLVPNRDNFKSTIRARHVTFGMMATIPMNYV